MNTHSNNNAGISTLYGVCNASGGSIALVESTLRDVVQDGGINVTAKELAEISRVAAETWRHSGGSRTKFTAGLKARLGSIVGGRKFMAAFTLACALHGLTQPWAAMAGTPGNSNSGEDIMVGSGFDPSSNGIAIGGGGPGIAGSTMGVYELGSALETEVYNGGDLYIYNEGLASGTTIFNGGTEHVSEGGSSLDAQISAGGLQKVSQGGWASGATISGGESGLGGGSQIVENGGSASATTISGNEYGAGTQVLSEGGFANETYVSEYGLQSILGGSAMSTTIFANGSQVVSGGEAVSTTISGSGAQTVSAGSAISTWIEADGSQTVAGSGLAVETYVSGLQNVFGGAALSTSIDEGGSQVVSGGNARSTWINDGSQIVSATGTASATSIGTDGVQVVETGGSAIETYVAGLQNIFGGSAISTVIDNGGSQVVSNGAVTSTIIYGVQTVSAGTVTSTWIEESGSQTVEAGGKAVETYVSGLQNIFGGTAEYTVIDSGGAQEVSSGNAISTRIIAGDQIVTEGGIARSTWIEAAGYQNVESGGSAIETYINSGLQYLDGGNATSTTIQKDGSQYVNEGIARSTLIETGGSQVVDELGSALETYVSGTQVVLGKATSTIITDNGSQAVSDGGLATTTWIENGGSQTIVVDGSAHETYVTNGLQTLEGGAATSTILSANGSQHVSNSGLATSTHISSGGYQVVSNGGNALSTVISSGGSQTIFEGGIASATDISAFGHQTVSSGASAFETNILKDGVQTVEAGASVGDDTRILGGSQVVYGSAFGITVDSGGLQLVSTAAGYAESTVVSSGVQKIDGGYASGTTIQTNGSQVVTNGVVSSTTINSGTQIIADGGSANYTDMMGGMQIISANGSATSTILYSGAEQRISGGLAEYTEVDGAKQTLVTGSAFSTVVTNNGTQEILGGTATSTTVNSGTQTVSGGLADTTDVLVGSQNIFGGSAVSTTLRDGTAQTITGGGATSTWLEGNATQTLLAGSARETYVSGAQFVYGGSAIDTTISGGASQVISGAGSATNTTVQTDGKQFVSSGGLAIDTTLEAFAGQIISGGQASGTILNGDDASQFIYAGKATSTTINSGGSQTIFADGSAYATIINEGIQEINGGQATSTTVGVYGVQSVVNGLATSTTVLGNQTLATNGSAIDTIVEGIQDIQGGFASKTTVKEYANQFIENGGSALHTTVKNLGSQFVTSGTATSTTIEASGSQTVEALGKAEFTQVAGTQTIVGGGSVENTTVSAGGFQDLVEGTATSTTILTGGSQVISVDGDAFYTDILGSQTVLGSATHNTVSSGGHQTVSSGGIATDTTVMSNGTQVLDVNGRAESTLVSGGAQIVLAEAVALSTTLSAGGTQTVSSGGEASSTTILEGGTQTIASDGKAIETKIAGGAQNVSSGGVASGTEISSGGVQNIFEGGLAELTDIYSGGDQRVSSGGSANYTEVHYGGSQTVLNNGYASATTVSSGGHQVIADGGSAVSTIIEAGGGMDVLSGGKADGFVQSSGVNVNVVVIGNDNSTYVAGTNESGSFLLQNGVASNFILYAEGSMHVSSGGSALDTIVSAGGSQVVSNLGSAISTTLRSGGALDVKTGGWASAVHQDVGGNVNVVVKAGDTTYVEGVKASGETFSLSDGIASGFSLYANGLMDVSAGGSALDTNVGTGATMNVQGASAIAISTVLDGEMNIFAGGSAVDTNVGVDGTMNVQGGTALATILHGSMHVSGTTAVSDTTINANGRMTVENATATSTTVNNGGFQTLLEGGVASATTVNTGGTLAVGTGTTGILAGDNVIHNGGVLDADDISLNAGATLEFERNTASSQSTNISGAGSLKKTGTGVLTLTGANTYTGGTDIAAGTLAGSIGSGSLAISGNAIYDGMNAAVEITELTGAAGASIKNTSGLSVSSGVYSGNIDATNTGGLNKKGGGSLLIAGTNAYTGGTVIEGGSLSGNLAKGTDLTMSGGTFFDGIGHAQEIGALNGAGTIQNTNGLTVNVTSGVTASWAGNIDNSNTGLTKKGVGILTFTGVNGFDGALTIQNGTFALAGGSINASQYTIWGGATFDVGATSKTITNLTVDRAQWATGNDSAAKIVGNVTLGGTDAANKGFITFNVPSNVKSGTTFLTVDGNVTAEYANVSLALTSGHPTFEVGEKLVLIDATGTGNYNIASLTTDGYINSDDGYKFYLLKDGNALVAVNTGDQYEILVISTDTTKDFVSMSGSVVTFDNDDTTKAILNINDGITLTVENDLSLGGSTVDYGKGRMLVEGNVAVGQNVTLAAGILQIEGTGGTVGITGGKLRNNAEFILGDDTATNPQSLGGNIAIDVENAAAMSVESGTWTLASGKTLTNQVGGTLTVAGTLDLRSGSVANAGTVEVHGGTLNLAGSQINSLISGIASNQGTAIVDDNGVIDVAATGGTVTLDASRIMGNRTDPAEIGKIFVGDDGTLRIRDNLNLTGTSLDMGAVTNAKLQTYGNLSFGSLTVAGKTRLDVLGNGVAVSGQTLSLLGTGGSNPTMVFGSADAESGGTISGNFRVGAGATDPAGEATGTLQFVNGTWTIQSGSLSVAGTGSTAKIGDASGFATRLNVGNGVTVSVTEGGVLRVLNNGTLSLNLSDYNTATNEKISLDAAGKVILSGVGTRTIQEVADLKAALIGTSTGHLELTDVVINDSKLNEIIANKTGTYDELFNDTNGILKDLDNVGIQQTADVVVTNVRNEGKLTGVFAKVTMDPTGSDYLLLTEDTTLTGGTTGGTLVTYQSETAGVSIVDATFIAGDTRNPAQKVEVSYVDFRNSTSAGMLDVVGDLTATQGIYGGNGTAGKGGVTVEAGAKLTTPFVGKDTDYVATFGATSASVDVTSGIYARDLNLVATTTNAGESDIMVTSAANIVGGSVRANNLSAGTLTLNGVAAALTGTMSGNRIDAADASISTNNLTVGTEGATFNGGTLVVADTMTIGGDTTLKNGLSGSIGTLTSENARTVKIGDTTDTKGTRISIANFRLAKGSVVALDPDFVPGSLNGDGSTVVAIRSVSESEALITDFGVGRNSYLTIGTSDAYWLTGVIDQLTNGQGLTRDGITAALGVTTPVALGGGGIYVDGSKDSTGITAAMEDKKSADLTFASGSLLVVTGDAATNAAFYSTGTGDDRATASIGDNAKLAISKATVNQTYTILDPNTIKVIEASENAWTGSNLISDTPMVKLTGQFVKDGEEYKYTAKATLNNTKNWMPNLNHSIGNVIDRMYDSGKADPNSASGGVKFLSRITNSNYLAGDVDLATRTVESAARVAAQAGVPQVTMLVSEVTADAAGQRTSLLGSLDGDVFVQRLDGTREKGAPGNEIETEQADEGSVERSAGSLTHDGVALWVKPMYQNRSVNGMQAGNYDTSVRGDIAGITIGGDVTFLSMARAGVNFSTGGGYLKGGGDLATTENRTNFWSVGTYAGITGDRFGLSADANFTETSNAVSQSVPGQMQMGSLKADIRSHAFVTGVRGEVQLGSPSIDVITHAGARYGYYTSDAFKMKSDGTTVLKGKSTAMNVWTFPVGIVFSKDLPAGNGWFVKPSLGFTVTPVAGDTYSKSYVRFTGTEDWAETGTQVMDPISYKGNVGIDFGTKDVRIGLHYNLTKSEHVTNHAGQFSLRYEF
jgi:autotransporter passenger strand-loop-strand repeat protein/autotransporter-associated beta strand protein